MKARKDKCIGGRAVIKCSDYCSLCHLYIYHFCPSAAVLIPRRLQVMTVNTTQCVWRHLVSVLLFIGRLQTNFIGACRHPLYEEFLNAELFLVSFVSYVGHRLMIAQLPVSGHIAQHHEVHQQMVLWHHRRLPASVYLHCHFQRDYLFVLHLSVEWSSSCLLIIFTEARFKKLEKRWGEIRGRLTVGVPSHLL